LDQAQELKKPLLAKLRQPVDHLERPRALQYEWCGGFRFVMGAPPVIIQEKKWQWISIENILVTWGSPLWLEKPPHFHVELLYFLQLHTLKPGHLVINRNDITGTCKWTFIPPNMKYINGSEKESWCFPTERERESLSMSTSS
jgi:hypothetical protein